MSTTTDRDNRLNTMELIKHYYALGPGHFFDPATMRFFGSRVSVNVYPTGVTSLGTLFVTSEREDEYRSRRYTIKRATLNFGPQGFPVGVSITTEGEYRQYASGPRAHRAARRMRDSEQRMYRPEWFEKE